jgi:hypothetical protein
VGGGEFKLRARCVGPLHESERLCRQAARQHKVWPQLKGSAELLDGLVIPARPQQEVAEVHL